MQNFCRALKETKQKNCHSIPMKMKNTKKLHGIQKLSCLSEVSLVTKLIENQCIKFSEVKQILTILKFVLLNI